MEIQKRNQEYHPTSLQIFTTKIDAIQVMKEIKTKSAVQVMESNAFTLATARKESGIEHAEKLIGQFVVETANALNMMSSISESSIQAIAEDVYSVGFFLNIEELGFFFKQLRRGVYGELYNNLNSIKVCTALNRYISERFSYFERKSISEHQANKESAAKRTNEDESFRAMVRKSVLKYNSGK